MVVSRRVIVLAGPSGSGKSHLAERLGLPVLRLDDFYKSVSTPDLPLIEVGANTGLVDWDHPDSWRLDDAVDAIAQLCQVGHTDVPVYSIPESRPVGTHLLDMTDHRFFIAEGIFATEVVARCDSLGLLAGAYCIHQNRVVTFWRRLTRDLRERRKPPLVLLRRGVALMRDQPRVVAHAVSKGCRAIRPEQAYALLSRLVTLPAESSR